MGSALVTCLVIGLAGSASAATLDFTGTLSLRMGTYPALVVPGAGAAHLTDDGSFHLLSLTLPGGAFGPTTAIVTLTFPSTSAIRLTLAGNLAGSFGGISGGPPGGGSMGLQGVAKICLMFDCFGNVTVPLTPTASTGLGVGGTQTVPPGAIALTLQHAPWTIGQPVMTIHTPGSTISTPTLAGGFAHGPASLTSSTAQTSGALQLVTASKVYTSLGGIPETYWTSIVTLHFVPEPGTLLLLATGALPVAVLGWRRRRRR